MTAMIHTKGTALPWIGRPIRRAGGLLSGYVASGNGRIWHGLGRGYRSGPIVDIREKRFEWRQEHAEDHCPCR